jgi:hypothetical protein
MEYREAESYFVVVAWMFAWALLVAFLVWILLPAIDIIFHALGI